MIISQYSPLIKGLALVFFLSCNTANRKNESNLEINSARLEYKDRVNNIFHFTTESKYSISFSGCNSFIILQTNLCNSCNKDVIDMMIDSLSNQHQTVYFILADHNTELQKKISSRLKESVVLFDEMQLLPKYNLNFMRNVKIKTCQNKVVDWSFL
ncbi:MAG: hypothetical protein IT248_10095 [Chitinophagaceae bacterium]|jgi:hypothetical protein|nr:hypothetical protein [Chitinophagaceae bacterium]HRF23068.1 hypothetical protein [Chitinophagaceae bacterium]